MRTFYKRLDKLEAALNPRGERRRSDEEEEKEFFKCMSRFRSLLKMPEEQIQVFLKLFEIEKEEARKENRPLESWWNVMWLVPDDPMDYQARQKTKLMHRCPPLSKEHREIVKQLFLKVGHPFAKTM